MATQAEENRSGWTRSVPSVFATILTVLAVLCALMALSLVLRERVYGVRQTIERVFVPAPPNLAYALFIGVLAAAVSRRKRVAYWLLLGYFALQIVLDAFLGALMLYYRYQEPSDVGPVPTYLPYATAVNALLATVAVLVLTRAKHQFYASVQTASLRKAIVVFGALAVLFTGAGYALVTAFPGTLEGGRYRFSWTMEKVFGGAVKLDIARTGGAPGWVNFTVGLFGAVALFAALFTLFRSQRAAAVLPAEDERRLRQLLAEHGERDSLGYFATRRDKVAIFSPSGKAAVTYRVVAGVSLASADPIGDPEAWGHAIEEWLAEAEAHGWATAVMGASEEGATAYKRAGLRVLELGDEAILYASRFSLDGRDMRVVRQAVNRVERAGHTARIRRHADISAEEMVRIVTLAAQWRDTETERGFSMALGRLGDPADNRCVLVECLDAEGNETALLSLSPWGARGLSLDLMRRDRGADNGLMEFMVASLMAACPGLGVDRVSLNFAMFRSVFDEGGRIGAGPVLLLWRKTLLFFSRWYQLESLYRSNAKYHPEWLPRFVCFAERRELIRISIAFGIAEGFVTVPSLPQLFNRGRRDVTAERDVHDIPPAVVRQTVGGPVYGEQTLVRIAKLERLRGEGREPYPLGYDRTATCADVVTRFPGLAPDTATGERVSLAGRVLLLRDHGGVCFARLRDWTGDVQLLLTGSAIGTWGTDIDLGDHVGVTGEIVASRRGELSVRVEDWTLTAKCLRPLPDKRHGLGGEAAVRQRYLDLAVNAGTRAVLTARSAAVHSLRTTLIGQGYLEVETPMLQTVHGGANARPFRTHMNAYDMDLYLRIAPELYLKRLAVGGVEKVFELGRTFRNEGVSYKHNPEFTMLEAYEAYADYTIMRVLAQDLIQNACRAANGSLVVGGHDLGGDWPVVPVNAAISRALGEEVTADTEVPALRKLCQAARVPLNPQWNRGQIVLEMYERLVEEPTTAPTFYTDFPTEVSPLTRPHRDDPRLAERWDLVAYGTELGTAYSELVDPIEQRRRLTEQSLLAAGGDPEAMEVDEDFLTALEYAMPPTGGLGLGVDRLVMLLTGKSIRETLAFPLVRAR
ncbi:bifunctional lysylphosphatidylglycerol synthetase/lysine--tRNA ligase LysX [Longispora urticae]